MKTPVPAFDFADAELTCWRHLGPRCQALVETVLAAQGDTPDPQLVELQHCLSELNPAQPVSS